MRVEDSTERERQSVADLPSALSALPQICMSAVFGVEKNVLDTVIFPSRGTDQQAKWKKEMPLAGIVNVKSSPYRDHTPGISYGVTLKFELKTEFRSYHKGRGSQKS